MPSVLKPITVWGRGGPNPPKVAMLLKELGLPHELNHVDFSEVKAPWYLDINPNGRMPAIQDPNSDITVWESGAILEYLVEEYDREHKLSFPRGTPEYYHAKQWLFFQASGQGPYYGQMVWFQRYHSENISSAVERYVNEINRVTGVLEGHLAKQNTTRGGDGPWIVGNRMSYVDLAWFPYQHIIQDLASKEQFNLDDYPHVKAWLTKLLARPAVEAVTKDNERIMAEATKAREARVNKV